MLNKVVFVLKEYDIIKHVYKRKCKTYLSLKQSQFETQHALLYITHMLFNQKIY